MSFVKTGQAQPFSIVSSACEICGQGKAEHCVDGKMICTACRDKLQTPAQA